jgi:hypothetical protein
VDRHGAAAGVATRRGLIHVPPAPRRVDV